MPWAWRSGRILSRFNCRNPAAISQPAPATAAAHNSAESVSDFADALDNVVGVAVGECLRN